MASDHDPHAHHEHSYQAAIGGYRAEKDEFFKSSPNSPIPEDERAAFEGLPYYPLDEDLVIEGLRLEPYAGNEPSTFEIPTSDGKLRPANRAGTFSFELGGGPRRLTAYQFAGGGATRSSSRSSTRRAAARPTAPDATWTSSRTRTARTRSTSTSPTTRRASTRRSTRAH